MFENHLEVSLYCKRANFIFKSPTNTLYGNFDATTQTYAAFRLQAAGSNYGFIGQTSGSGETGD